MKSSAEPIVKSTMRSAHHHSTMRSGHHHSAMTHVLRHCGYGRYRDDCGQQKRPSQPHFSLPCGPCASTQFGLLLRNPAIDPSASVLSARRIRSPV
jgi:hypothetical protein